MDKTLAWANFWETGSLTSFGDRFAAGYQGEIRAYWVETFRHAPQGAVVVDFGAGNGALEEIAFEVATEEKHALHMHAYDLAPALPQRFEKSVGDSSNWTLDWHPGSRNEDTGLGDGTVDLVVGNYAFEYGDDALSSKETARILKPDGGFCFLMHHAESNIITGAKVELAVLDEVFSRNGFLDYVQQYITRFGNIRHAKQFEKFRKGREGEPLRQKLNEAHQAAVKHCSTENSVRLMSDISKWCGELLQPPGLFSEKSDLQHRFNEITRFLEANRARLSDMQAAGVSAERIGQLGIRFEENGCSFEAEKFHVSEVEEPVAWKVTGRRQS